MKVKKPTSEQLKIIADQFHYGLQNYKKIASNICLLHDFHPKNEFRRLLSLYKEVEKNT